MDGTIMSYDIEIDTASTKNEVYDPESEYVELEEDFIVLAIPANTVELQIRAKVFNDGDVIEVGNKFSFACVRKMFKEAQDGYIPSDAVFSLAKVGEDKIRSLLEKYLAEEDD